jgi:putative radical SAM enzyme (TIGR03279 family)
MAQGKRVERVEPDSIAAELMIGPGDEIIAINDTEPADILDWRLAESSEDILLAVRHADGELVEYEIEKEYDEPLGIIFDSPTLDTIRSCQNRCVFCFVDQMPKAMRETLYIKDDDYRLSFLSGSYITLTNLKEQDIARISGLHLSPLYVSVHTTNPELRKTIMNHRRAGEILSVLSRLAEAGISFHTQVVLCPGLNDGEELEKTIQDLYALYPAVQSLAVVPVGLTGHRAGLYQLSPADQSHARGVLAQITRWQQHCLAQQGTRFVFASDEFYTAAGAPIPADEAYEDYLQLENGVGLIRLLLNDWDAWQENLPQSVQHAVSATVATGVSAAAYLKPVIDRLNEIPGVDLTLIPVENRFFGGYVTVAGLLMYSDLVNALQNKDSKEKLYLPAVLLKEGRELFLDGYTIDDLTLTLQKEIRIVDSLDEFLTDLLELEMR